ncbi:hypothetical protein TSAR_002720 [Trichomalopsis sarcophagae]|uniref:Uncharacterized protein n=1 Tax=Trichomalopsis sarcophagae TaxID=543379 RepID=A0A232F3G8_9HYME|nr:hypothetical protein TSAR_002720 [Trichomalopsis sarcophagae]
MARSALEGKRDAFREADFQWAFGLNRLSLDAVGIWPTSSSSTSCDCKRLRIPLMLVWVLICVLLPQMYALTQVYHRIPLVVDNLTTSCTALTSSIKLFLLWNSRQGADRS